WRSAGGDETRTQLGHDSVPVAPSRDLDGRAAFVCHSQLEHDVWPNRDAHVGDGVELVIRRLEKHIVLVQRQCKTVLRADKEDCFVGQREVTKNNGADLASL